MALIIVPASRLPRSALGARAFHLHCGVDAGKMPAPPGEPKNLGHLLPFTPNQRQCFLGGTMIKPEFL